VYRYDLSLPSAVGLTFGQPNVGGGYPNQVLDYVANLERFVQGFAVARPLSTSTDSEILTLPGPGAMMTDEEQEAPDPGRAMWSVLCPAPSRCAPSSRGWCALSPSLSVEKTCEAQDSTSARPHYLRPERIRATFTLDPWGHASELLTYPYILVSGFFVLYIY
jgi:hypothetical protein